MKLLPVLIMLLGRLKLTQDILQMGHIEKDSCIIPPVLCSQILRAMYTRMCSWHTLSWCQENFLLTIVWELRMNKQILLVALLGATVLFAGCATQSSNQFQNFQAIDLNDLVRSGQLVQKTNSFFVLSDSSSSMGDDYQRDSSFSGTKLDVEKNLLHRFNQTIPDITLSSGLRSFGFGSCLGWSRTQLNQSLQPHSTGAFDAAIQSLECSSGGTPLAKALATSQQDLTSASGNIALLIFSDGKDDNPSVSEVKALKNKFGDRLCVYTVWIGNERDRQGAANLRAISNVAGCGFSTNAEAISSSQGIADFVKGVFFESATPFIAENDEDQDGVVDSRDKCPNTPRGAIVDKGGCWAFHGMLFDFDSDKIKPEYHAMIQNVVKVLELNPGLTIEIQGHTDSIGSEAYNQRLSERRANAVKNLLVREGIDGNRLATVGFGELQPVDSNDTEEGRAYNRRVTYTRTDQ
jgi:OOP family OmpA-OmpF porin